MWFTKKLYIYNYYIVIAYICIGRCEMDLDDYFFIRFTHPWAVILYFD